MIRNIDIIIITMDSDSNTSQRKLADIRRECTPGNDEEENILQESMAPDSDDELYEQEDSD